MIGAFIFVVVSALLLGAMKGCRPNPNQPPERRIKRRQDL